MDQVDWAFFSLDDLALLGVDTAPGPIIIASSLVAAGLLVSGAYYFRRMEKMFADVV